MRFYRYLPFAMAVLLLAGCSFFTSSKTPWLKAYQHLGPGQYSVGGVAAAGNGWVFGGTFRKMERDTTNACWAWLIYADSTGHRQWVKADSTAGVFRAFAGCTVTNQNPVLASVDTNGQTRLTCYDRFGFELWQKDIPELLLQDITTLADGSLALAGESQNKPVVGWIKPDGTELHLNTLGKANGKITCITAYGAGFLAAGQVSWRRTPNLLVYQSSGVGQVKKVLGQAGVSLAPACLTTVNGGFALGLKSLLEAVPGGVVQVYNANYELLWQNRLPDTPISMAANKSLAVSMPHQVNVFSLDGDLDSQQELPPLSSTAGVKSIISDPPGWVMVAGLVYNWQMYATLVSLPPDATFPPLPLRNVKR